METTNSRKHEAEELISSMQEPGSTSSCLAMVGCMVSLLVMLCACSPPAQAQAPTPQASSVEAHQPSAIVPMGRLTVLPSPEDVAPPRMDRWQRFEVALHGGQSRNYRVVEWTASDASRMACRDPCLVNCCTSSGGFTLAGRGVGR